MDGVEFLRGPMDGHTAPPPMVDGAPAGLVDIHVPPVRDSMLDEPAVPAETHRYQWVMLWDQGGRVVYEWRGQVPAGRPEPWQAYLRKRRTSERIHAALQAASKLPDNPHRISPEMREAAIARIAERLGRSVDELRAEFDRPVDLIRPVFDAGVLRKQEEE
jgi:hypothetical protein